jgi:hypothetical protein
MPMPKRASVDDFFAQLNDVQRPHLEALRALSRAADPEAREQLKWNLPVYVRGENTNLWTLQNFKNHCSPLRGRCGFHQAPPTRADVAPKSTVHAVRSRRATPIAESAMP